MKTNLKLIFSLFLGITSLGANFDALGRSFAPSGDQKVAPWYENCLNQEEKELRTQLMTMVDVKDESEWQEAKNNLNDDYRQACKEATALECANKPLPDKIITAIYGVLSNSKIQNILGVARVEQAPDKSFVKIFRYGAPAITIARGNDKIEADAATDRYTVLIDPEVLLETHANTAEIEATIAHEIIHILNDDDFEVFCIYKLCTKKKRKKRGRFKKIMNKWEQSQERRADMFSGLFDVKYAQANRDNFLRNMPKREGKPTTHPTDRQRYEYMAELVKAMEKAEENSWAAYGIALGLLAALILLAALLLVGAQRKNKKRRKKTRNKA